MQMSFKGKLFDYKKNLFCIVNSGHNGGYDSQEMFSQVLSRLKMY